MKEARENRRKKNVPTLPTRFCEENFYVENMREMVQTSARIYSDRNAFLVKERPGGPYCGISYPRALTDMEGLATSLLDLGLKDEKIAIIGESRYEWTLSFLAIESGIGVAVPLDRELPPVEIANLLERAEAAAIIFSGKTGKRLTDALSQMDESKKPKFCINMDLAENTDDQLSFKVLVQRGRAKVKAGDIRCRELPIDPEAMGVLLFTSGTTGYAKGVMLSQKAILANVMNMQKVVHIERLTTLSVLPIHHTYELTCDQLAVLYGGNTVAYCEGLKHIVKNLGEAKANVMLGVPLLFESIHKKIWKSAEKSGKAKTMRRAVQLSKAVGGGKTKAAAKVFKAVHEAVGGQMKLLIAGAAAIDPNVVEDFCAMGIPMIQGYGMTECCPIIALNPPERPKASAAGMPLPGTEIRIEDPDESGIGEIVAKSPSVMLGYYKDPEETAKVLKDGWLYTGDYGYLDSEGFVHITGRKKNVIVTKNGKNIFPEEVEFYLMKEECIKEVVVYGKEEEETGETIVMAAIFPNRDLLQNQFRAETEEDIRKLVKEAVDRANDQMPLYKRVKRFDLRDTEFEKTTTKKIKRFTALEQK
ncbi:MAG: long-chain fatty acid--CoA ligase [Clostridiales bacterium]|nr:long-chain fatty acid--CoA ligase [Clostridiales bacterium]